ncbi:MAG: NAD(P)/FAD-dependent oxidoreductase [Bacteroidota bacterium]
MKFAETIVIGAGPAGLFAAIHCEKKPVLVLEKNGMAGKKLLLAGSGRCNMTHHGNISEFMMHYGKNSRFMKTPLMTFDNEHLMAFFKVNGLNTYTDKNGKIFPITNNGGDVLKVLLQVCAENNVAIAYNQDVCGVEKQGDIFVISTGAKQFSCTHLVIATGGFSYPQTGSTGSGYRFANELGHTIVQPKPALAAVTSSTKNLAELAGVSLQNLLIYLYRRTRKIAEHRGDVVFTHKGVSGPGILDFSRYFEVGDVLKLNFTGLSPEDFRKYFMATAELEGKTSVLAFLKRFEIPRSVVLALLRLCDVESFRTLATINRTDRGLIVQNFSEFAIKIIDIGGFAKAMVTAGGVKVNEVYTKTMESKLVKNLFFAGEVLDVDGDSGGYNLQAAFSTGHRAGKSISQK